MGRVYNPTEEVVHTKMHGAWFVFQPGAQKTMSEEKCAFITQLRKETGLVVLPPQFDPSDDRYVEGYEKTDEGKKVIDEKRAEGIRSLISHHMDIVKNNQVALRNDMSRSNPAADPSTLAKLTASEGELESMRLVAKYSKTKHDQDAKKLAEVNQLMEGIGPIPD